MFFIKKTDTVRFRIWPAARYRYPYPVDEQCTSRIVYPVHFNTECSRGIGNIIQIDNYIYDFLTSPTRRNMVDFQVKTWNPSCSALDWYSVVNLAIPVTVPRKGKYRWLWWTCVHPSKKHWIKSGRDEASYYACGGQWSRGPAYTLAQAARAVLKRLFTNRCRSLQALMNMLRNDQVMYILSGEKEKFTHRDFR